MREFAKFSPQHWINETGRKIKRLGTETRLLSFYLLTNPHAEMIGIYYLPKTIMAHELGISHEQVVICLQQLSDLGFCRYDEEWEYIWVHEMAAEQIAPQLKPSDNRVKNINELYQNLPKLSFLEAFFEKYADAFHLEILTHTENPSKDLASKEKEKEKDNEKEKEKDIIMSGKPDVDHPKLFSFEKQKASPLQAEALEVLNFLNEKTGKAFRSNENIKLIIARLKTGATVMDCRQIIAKKNREWRGDPEMAKYLRPATLFNASKFEQYIGELVLPKEE